MNDDQVSNNKFLYLANIRLPTEKAHGLQIMQNCEAFAQTGVDVTLIVARRINTPEMARISDPWAYYGVEHNFAIRRIACIDFLAVGGRVASSAFAVQALTYTFVLAATLLFRHADIYYSRDLLTIFVLSLFKPQRRLGYEVHQLSTSRMGRLLQSWCVRRAGTVIAVTGKLAADLKARGADAVIVAHDGFRIERFANLPDRQSARTVLALLADAFIVGYAGRLQTLAMSKGLDRLIDAIAAIAGRPISLCLVGGPDEAAESLRRYWTDRGLPADRFLYCGHVAPSVVPMYLAAFDVCAMPSPNTDFFAYYASPLKLFEYMASRGAILGSDLPAMREVVRDDETALLVLPGDVPALAAALTRLYDDPGLRARLGTAAQRTAAEYSWSARARRIIAALRN